MRILVPVDGSDNAMRAIRYAIGLAKIYVPLELHIVTVHPEPIIYGEIQVYVAREKIERLQREHSTDILKPAIEAAKEAQVCFTEEILIGETAQSIVRRAEELHCDGIVMGTRGMGAIGNLVMGSTATKVIHLTRLPVTLIK
jgi:nucleotide-binding universal stress UspA family protein